MGKRIVYVYLGKEALGKRNFRERVERIQDEIESTLFQVFDEIRWVYNFEHFMANPGVQYKYLKCNVEVPPKIKVVLEEVSKVIDSQGVITMSNNIEYVWDDAKIYVIASAEKKWPKDKVERVRRAWKKGYIYSYGIARRNRVIAYAKVTRGYRVRWMPALPFDNWEVVKEEE